MGKKTQYKPIGGLATIRAEGYIREALLDFNIQSPEYLTEHIIARLCKDDFKVCRLVEDKDD